MHLFLLIAGIVCVVAWLYLLLLHGRFWMVQRFETGVSPLPSAAALIAVVIPARNEADVIARSVGSLLQQDYPGPLHVFVIDDNSTDGTAAAASAAAESGDHGATLSAIAGKPLPPGWSGKLWAVQQGVEQSILLKPKFLLLTDADIWHSPENLASLSAVADSADYDLASFMVKLHCRSMAEKLLIPAFVFFFFLTVSTGLDQRSPAQDGWRGWWLHFDSA